MTQEQLKEQFLEYYRNNLDNLTALKAIKEILDAITSELYYEGYVATSNKLTTCALIIEEIVKDEE